MEVILEERVPLLGGEGEVVKVADGYANNYLIPRGLAVLATKGNIKQLESKQKLLAKKSALLKAEMKKLAKNIDGKTVVLQMPANEKGRLFGAITSKDIVKVVREELKTEITKHQLKLAEQIKTVGRYEAKISLHGEVEADLIIEVEAKTKKAVE